MKPKNTEGKDTMGMEKYYVTSVLLTKEQEAWIKARGRVFNFSSWVREKLREEMTDEGFRRTFK